MMSTAKSPYARPSRKEAFLMPRHRKNFPRIAISAHLAAVLVGIVCSGGTSMAAELRCDRCSESGYVSRAKSAGRGTHYVYDVYKDQVRKYFVEAEPGPGGTWVYLADPMSVEPEVEDLVAKLSAFYHRTGGTMKAIATVDADGTIDTLTAYDAALPGASRTAIINWVLAFPSLSNTLPILGASIHALAAAAVNIFKGVPIQTIVTVRFSDGSTIKVSYNGLTNEAAVVEGSALDAVGNPIPATPPEASHINFDFTRDPTGRSANAMSSWLIRLGISLSGSGFRGLACTESPAGVQCTRF